MKKVLAWAVVALTVVSYLSLLATPVIAASNFNKQINYQGKLTDSSGIAVADGTYEMEFNLYTVASGVGAAIWTETRSVANEVAVADGLFSVLLGEVTSIASVDFNQTLYLSVEVENDGEMTPRKELGAVPAAFESDKLDGLDSTQFVRTDATSTIATSSSETILTINQEGAGDILNLQAGGAEMLTVTSAGNVGIGTSSPYAKLSVVGPVVAEYYDATTTSGYKQYSQLILFGATSTDFTSSAIADSGRNLFVGFGAGTSTIPDVIGLTGHSNTFTGFWAGQANTTAVGNSALGTLALSKNTTGAANSAFGVSTLAANIIGQYNSAFGYSALSVSTANYNSAFGGLALSKNTTGSLNSAFGYNALTANTTGGSNSAFGNLALDACAGACNFNNAFGSGALGSNTTGDSNVAFGNSTLANLTVGEQNSAFGESAMEKNVTGTDNVAVGFQAGYGVAANSFSSSTLLGYHSGYGLTTGSRNVLLGFQAGDAITSGQGNLIWGYDVDAPSATDNNQLNIGNLLFGTALDGTGSTLSSGNIGIGTSSPYAKLSVVGEVVGAGYDATTTSGYKQYGQLILFGATSTDFTDPTASAGNLFVGFGAGTSTVPNVSAYEGVENTFVGFWSGQSNTAGNANTANGFQSLFSNTTGYDNTAIGWKSLFSNTTGYDNTAVGYRSLYFNTEGKSNTASGYSSMYNNTTGNDNTASGIWALSANTTGSFNTANGASSLFSNTSGYFNVADGYESLLSNTTGGSNIGIGTNALRSNQTGSSSVAIGTEAGLGVASNSFSSSTLLGYRSGYGLTTGSRNVLLGFQSGDAITSGQGNLIFGYDIDAPSATDNNQLNIGNLLFGTALDGTGSTLSTGNIGIGTSTPYAKLSVAGIAGGTTPLFAVATSSTGIQASTTQFIIDSNGRTALGTTTSNWQLTVQGGICITAGTSCPVEETSGSLRVDTQGVNGIDDPGDFFDVAELYPASEVMEAGSIASLDSNSGKKPEVKNGINGEIIVGVVSTAPALAINGSNVTLGPDREATSTRPLIALVGRVPVKVNLENGPILKGDLVSASSEAGVGKRAISGEQTVGFALEDWSGSSGDSDRVLVFVQLGKPSQSILTSAINAVVDVWQAVEEIASVANEKIVAGVGFVGDLFTTNLTFLPQGTIKVPSGNNQIVGSAVLKAGYSQVFIPHTRVTENTKIFITPRVKISAPLVVGEVTSGEGFLVEMAEGAVTDTPFDWLIIDSYKEGGSSEGESRGSQSNGGSIGGSTSSPVPEPSEPQIDEAPAEEQPEEVSSPTTDASVDEEIPSELPPQELGE
ncbi:MAG TPA: hypothetical protein VJJ24_02515 [Candidatus Paceibacterota bacterium]